MEDFCIVVSLDDAFDCYEMSKRIVSETPLYYYDTKTNTFRKIKSTMPWYLEEPSIKASGIVFINSYKLCQSLIKEYLNQPSMKEQKDLFESIPKNEKNRIVDFLWFFEHIDGCYDFQKFEVSRVEKELKRWCKINKLRYLEPVVHRVDL